MKYDFWVIMARYEHLPIYKLIYDFILYFFKLSRNFPKDYKYGLAVEIRENLTKLLDKVIIANNSESKEEALKEAEMVVEQIKFKIRILKDMGIIGLTSYKFCAAFTTDICKQIQNWKSWSQRDRS